ncbi:MAG: hypothetical protein ABIH72_01315 [archaeon]
MTVDLVDEEETGVCPIYGDELKCSYCPRKPEIGVAGILGDMRRDLATEERNFILQGNISSNLVAKYFGFVLNCMPWTEEDSSKRDRAEFNRMLDRHSELIRLGDSRQKEGLTAVFT